MPLFKNDHYAIEDIYALSEEDAELLLGQIELMMRRLKPINKEKYNPNYEPMYFNKEEIEEKPVRIVGKVMELRRKF